MEPPSLSYFIRGDDGLEYGPVALDELRDWVQENRAGLGTDVRRDEPGAGWRPWQASPELVALLAEVTGTAAAPGLALAPMSRRVLAFGLDWILLHVLLTPVVSIILILVVPDWLVQCRAAAEHTPFVAPELPSGTDALIWALRDVFISVYFAGFIAAHGMTPAKQLFRLRVVDQWGQKPNLVKATLRALALAFSTVLFFLPLTYAFFNPQRRALHDFIAGTYVVEA